jgi:hypothetical protein
VSGLRAPANYEVTFVKPGYVTHAFIVPVAKKDGNVALDVTLAASPGTVSGTVAGPDGPLDGVAVTVTDGTTVVHTRTPAGATEGAWVVTGLATPSTWEITAELEGYGTETVSVELPGGASESGVQLRLTPGVGSIAGRVTGAGKLLADAVVTATDGTVTRLATTLADGLAGHFDLGQLPVPGSWTVTVAAEGFVTRTVTLTVTGNLTGVEIDLTPAAKSKLAGAQPR